MSQSNQKTTSAYRLDTDFDWGIVLVLMFLAVAGMAALFVAARSNPGATLGSALRPLLSQGFFWVVGAVMVVFLLRFDASQLWRLAPIAYGIGLLLLIAVLIFYSRSMAAATGAKSWFSFGSVTFQPSEVVKPAFILMLSRVVVQHNREYLTHHVKSDWLLLAKMTVVFLPVAILIKLQNDFGTLLVFAAIFGGLALVSGITWRILGPTIVIFGLVSAVVIFLVSSTTGRDILGHFGFQSYQFARIDSWIHPGQDTTNEGYQVYQNLKAIGSGELFGNGWGNMKVHVPVRESDMIFSVFGESFGFVGGASIIILYFVLIYMMIRDTFKAQTAFYAYIATGVVMMILFHVFENIGMSISLLPMTGIPLPFISQGGSSLLGNLIGVGLVLSIGYQKHHSTFNETTGFAM